MNITHLHTTQEPHSRDELLLLLLTAVFIFTNAITLSLARAGQVSGSYLWATALWFAAMLAAYALLRRYRPRHDPYLLPIFALLTGWGLITLQRLAPNFLERQVMWLWLSTAVLLAIAILPRSLRWLRRYRYTLLIGGILLLAATFLFGVNPSGFGAALWLPIPLVGRVFFQPSELLKLLLVIFLASYFDERESLLRLDGHHGRFGALPYLAPLLLMWGFCMALLIWQRDLGAATLFFLLFLALLYLASGDWRYVVGGLILLLAGSIFAYFAFDVVALRVNAWWNPWPDASNRAYQIVQSLYAIAAGGLAGQGVAQGFPNYIPVVHSDFVFAAVAEEWGLAGSLTVVVCFLVLAYRGIKIAALATRPFRRYLAAGITVIFAAQAVLIMGGVVKLLPLTGVTLPFISYGGSSLLVSSIMAGLLLYLSASSGSGRALHLPAMQQRLQQLLTVILIGYLLVAISLVYWGFARAQTILARSDNPRLVEAELRIQRGAIFDRNGNVLAETISTPQTAVRQYPIAAIGPAVGYYSFRHGASGVEEGYNTVLRGDPTDFWQQIVSQNLHQPQTGQTISLSLDARLQQIADALLGERPGAMLLLDTQTGEILAMASHPTYDPNRLDAEFETLVAAKDAPLLNRAAQGQYQPGLLLQPFLLAAALEQGLIRLDEIAPDANRPVTVNGQTLQCATPPPDPATWANVLAHRCPGPMQTLAAQLGIAGLNRAFADFGLTAVPDLPLNTEISPLRPLTDAALAGIGQENLVLTPLQLARAWGSLAGDGRVLNPQLVTAVWDDSGRPQPITPPAANSPVSSSETARAIRQALTADGRIEFSDRVLSGPDGSTNSWYVGLTPADSPRYLAVVVVEGGTAVSEAAQIGRALLDTAAK
ncbi:MAG: FtsW/RodA/SpoVE family cell cycle protein [Anaerolineae bacterium]|nr:FtsW/RodA/SpoVE family cell cycle protein [Anaerolineae bacterium]